MFVPWSRPRGAVHDLQHMLSLDDTQSILLCVSPRTLYVLQNIAALDVEFTSRYAVALYEHGYEALTEDHALYSVWLQSVHNLQLELFDMSCSIESGLRAIADAIAKVQLNVACGGGNGVATPAQALVHCIDEYQRQTGAAFENDYSDIELTELPEGFDTWEQYQAYKCKAANAIWRARYDQLVSLSLMTATWTGIDAAATVLGIFGLVAWVALPVTTILALSTLLVSMLAASAGMSYWVRQAADRWYEQRGNIICTLYNTGSAAAAVNVLQLFLQDAIEIISWGALLAPVAPELTGFLTGIMSYVTDTNFVRPLFELNADVASVVDESYINCSEECQQYEFYWDFDEQDADGWQFSIAPDIGYPEPQNYAPQTGGAQFATGRNFVGYCLHAWVEKSQAAPSAYLRYTRNMLQHNVVATASTVFSAWGRQSPAENLCTGWRLRIQYLDGSQDLSELYENPTDWVQRTVSPTTANVGKVVSKLVLEFSAGPACQPDPPQVYTYFYDDVSFVA